jgi:G3E family GTPase
MRSCEQAEMADALVLINEFGEVGLDHLLVAHSQEHVVVEMSSGCLCCTIRGDIALTLQSALDAADRNETRRFSRVVIETVGLADPGPIVHTLATHASLKERLRFDGVATTVDARNGAATLDQHIEAVKQAAMADRLLVTKTDLIDEETLSDLIERLRSINPVAQVMHVAHGELNARRILDLGLFSADGKIADVQKWLVEERIHEREHHHDHHDHGKDHDHGHHHHKHDVNRHDDQIRAFCFTIDDPIPHHVLTEWLDVLLTLMGALMLRIKGILNVSGEDRPVVIHGVQHVFHPPVMLEEWPSDDRRSRIVFITRSIGRDTIEQSFRIFSDADTIRKATDDRAD